jgi:uncharacterized protein (TIGR03083 family)
MHRDEIWTAIHGERRALAADLSGLDDAGWSKPTPCADWTVNDVLAHMVAAAVMAPPAFFGKLAGSGFSLTKLQAKDVARLGAGGGKATLQAFVEVESSTKHPPGPTPTWLGETIIHAEDIRSALGIAHEYPVASVVEVADSYKRTNLVIGAKRRMDGLTFTATDTSWTHGSGPQVSGPMLQLLIAMTGRTSPLDKLSGDGVATLRSRT